MEIVNNKRNFKFEAHLPDGEIATIEYRWLKGSMVLMHTITPAAHRGKGVGAVLVKYVLDYARQQGLKIIVYCQYVAQYLQKHPEYNDLIDATGGR
jgi:hypothetical protein